MHASVCLCMRMCVVVSACVTKLCRPPWPHPSWRNETSLFPLFRGNCYLDFFSISLLHPSLASSSRQNWGEGLCYFSPTPAPLFPHSSLAVFPIFAIWPGTGPVQLLSQEPGQSSAKEGNRVRGQAGALAAWPFCLLERSFFTKSLGHKETQELLFGIG